MDLVSNFLSQKNIVSEITFEKYIKLNTKLNNEKQYSEKTLVILMLIMIILNDIMTKIRF